MLQGLGVFAAFLLASGQSAPQVAPSSPPLYQPGAPGVPGRVITAEESVALGRSTWTDDDVRFMQHMIIHHAQAVDMVALLEVQGSSPVVQALGRRIALGQASEINLMREWLTARGLPIEAPMAAMDMHAGHGGHMDHPAASDDQPVMPGMLSPRQMRELAAASGPEFDRLFLEGMIQHHQGALDMVDSLMSHPNTANDPTLSDFMSSVVADQSAEILRMQNLLSEL